MEEPDLAGATIAGRYDVLALIGAGGMGKVYRAHDRELDELVALKVIRSDRANHAGMVEQFRHEVKLARRVTHINIARTFELGFSDGVMYCTMELVEGESLRARMARTRTLPPAEAATIARALCSGLEVAHGAGVIHRDIKPDNVLLAANGRVVLADFGVAAITQTETGGFLAGTLEYMAPEQARGEPPTPASDVYAVGVVLFEMLSGARAFAGSMSDILVAKQDIDRLDLARAPDSLRDVIARATARDVVDRFATARDLADALEPWSTALPTSTPSVVSPELATVVVLAPRGNESGRLHLAQGVHHELLRRLSRQPRLRVWPRMAAVDTDARVVTMEATDVLAVTIVHAGTSIALELPLDIASLEMTAAAIAGAITESIASPVVPPSESFELLLRARTLGHHGFMRSREALLLLRRAHALDPEDPAIAAELAAVLVRNHFMGADFEDTFQLAPVLIERALAAAPNLAEAHVAAAHLQLHVGDPVVAANEYRTAIACSPFLAEPHEGLGRMLLEAGFLADAVARIEDALAIAPNLSIVRWEIARAHALEQNWNVYDQLADELRRVDDRPLFRMRIAMWRGDRTTLRELRKVIRGSQFEAEMFEQVFASLVDGDWSRHRDRMIQRAMTGVWPSQRRNAFIAQVVAETAGYVGDPVCVELVRRLVDFGFFDLHWLDRCPSIEIVRAHPTFPAVRDILKRRADGIHDALFRDHDGIHDTLFAGS